jgi:hypothetical protein
LPITSNGKPFHRAEPAAGAMTTRKLAAAFSFYFGEQKGIPNK